MEDWFHDILAHLYYSYPLDRTFRNINDYLIKDLHIEPSHPGHMHSLSSIIYILTEKKYIEGNAQPPQNEIARGNVIGIINHGAGFTTANDLTTHKITIRLTLDGYDYITKWEREKKQYKTTTRINKWFWVTIFVAILGALISLGNFIINYRAETRLSLEASQDSTLQLQHLQLLQKDSLLKRDSLMIDSLKNVSKQKTDNALSTPPVDKTHKPKKQ